MPEVLESLKGIDPDPGSYQFCQILLGVVCRRSIPKPFLMRKERDQNAQRTEKNCEIRLLVIAISIAEIIMMGIINQ